MASYRVDNSTLFAVSVHRTGEKNKNINQPKMLEFYIVYTCILVDVHIIYMLFTHENIYIYIFIFLCIRICTFTDIDALMYTEEHGYLYACACVYI